MIIAYYCCKGSAEEHQRSNGEVWNSFSAGVSRAVEFVYPDLRGVLGGWLGPRPVGHCSYLDVDQNIKSHTVNYKQIVRRGTMTPYDFKCYDPAHIITGIACGPQDDKTSSPEAEVVGGINYHHVMIRLSSVHKGSWACCREICRMEENSVYMTCYRPTDCIRYVHSLHVLSEECILLGLIPCSLVDTLHFDPF